MNVNFFIPNHTSRPDPPRRAIRHLVRSLTPAAGDPSPSALPDPRGVFRSPGVGLFHFDFLLNFQEKRK